MTWLDIAIMALQRMTLAQAEELEAWLETHPVPGDDSERRWDRNGVGLSMPFPSYDRNVSQRPSELPPHTPA